MKKVLCFGNELVAEDALAQRLGRDLARDPRLHGFQFVACGDPSDLIEEFQRDDVYILDVARDVTEPIFFDDLDRLQAGQAHSAHQLDLTFYLSLYHTTGDIQRVRIIGVPADTTHLSYEDIRRRVADYLLGESGE
jgi:Ni,Fe-hydrogenase maturation factor